MKILQVVPFFGPRHGGSFIVAFQLSKALVKKGHEVTMITSDYQFDDEFADQNRDVKIIPFKSLLNLSSYYYTPSMKRWSNVNLDSFDIIHLHNYRSYQNNILRAVAEKKGVKFILQPHGSFPKVGGKKVVKSIYDLLWGNKVIDQSCYIIAVSNLEERQLLDDRVDQKKIKVIPNGIDPDQYQVLPDKLKFRREIGVDDKTKLVLFVGRLHPIKGINFLIRTFAQVTHVIEDSKLVIAGSDYGQLKELKSLVGELGIEREVIFTGHVSETRRAYVASDLLVYPSAYEIFGLVPFEALMCGIPVIVTKDCGCGEIIKEAECGLLVDYGDTNDLSEKIIQLFADRDLTLHLVTNGQKYILQNLSWDEIVQSMEGAYENCIHNV
ncbi:MAG: glycosyltransferase family 4 protein [Methanomassiliicoccales archaeon]